MGAIFPDKGWLTSAWLPIGALRVEIGMKDLGSEGAKQLALVLRVNALLEAGGT
jgi:hypothetical protein